ncbi:hypothetical protein AAG906_011854 [Vitis piasezkii]
MGFIDGTEACPPKHIASGSLNPAYVVWQKKDQVWTALQTRFSSQSRSRISHLKRQLQTLTQGTKSCSEYLESAKTLADQLAAAGKPVDDQDLISFLLGGLQSSYTPFVTSFNFASRETDFTFEDFQAELLGYENLLDVNHSVHNTDGPHFAFAANKSKAPTYGRFPPQDLAAMVAETNATFDHQVWYMDSGANAHITSDATNLTHQQPFRESETVTVGNGSGEPDRQNSTSRCLDFATKRVYISRHVIFDEHSFPAKELAEYTTSRRTNPPAVVPSPADPSSPSIQMPILAASTSTQQSPTPASNDYSPPPTSTFENPIEPDIVIPPISHSPQVCR